MGQVALFAEQTVVVRVGMGAPEETAEPDADKTTLDDIENTMDEDGMKDDAPEDKVAVEEGVV